MRGLNFIVLVGVSLLPLQPGVTLGDSTVANTKVPEDSVTKATHTAKRINCRGPMNAVRTEVGLPGFGEAKEDSKLPVAEDAAESAPHSKSSQPTVVETAPGAENQATFLQKFCSALPLGSSTDYHQNQEKGTYMYAPATSEDSKACAAAVEYWKGAATNFPTLPPVYSSSEQLYTNSRNVSFVGLFNTSSSPTVDCAFVICNAQTQGNVEDVGDDDEEEEEEPSESVHTPIVASSHLVSDAAPSSSPVDNGLTVEATTKVEGAKTPEAHKEAQGTERRLSDAPSPTYSLLCLSSPQALRDSQAPFTQEQWDKINGAESSATQHRVLGTLGVAVASLLYLSF